MTTCCSTSTTISTSESAPPRPPASARERIVVDPGIGFGKALDHNLALLRGLSLFHALGCAVLLGASRKAFIGRLGGAPEPKDRGPGTVAVTHHALSQGVQMQPRP